MSSAVRKSKYTYSSSGGGNADVSIEYSADLSALTRLEVSEIRFHDEVWAQKWKKVERKMWKFQI